MVTLCFGLTSTLFAQYPVKRLCAAVFLHTLCFAAYMLAGSRHPIDDSMRQGRFQKFRTFLFWMAVLPRLLGHTYASAHPASARAMQRIDHLVAPAAEDSCQSITRIAWQR